MYQIVYKTRANNCKPESLFKEALLTRINLETSRSKLTVVLMPTVLVLIRYNIFCAIFMNYFLQTTIINYHKYGVSPTSGGCIKLLVYGSYCNSDFSSIFMFPLCTYSVSCKDPSQMALEIWSYSEIPGEDEFRKILLKSLQQPQRHVSSQCKEASIQ